MMDFELKTPFKNDIYFKQNYNNIKPNERIFQRNSFIHDNNNDIDINNKLNNNINDINKLKNDLTFHQYNNAYMQNNKVPNFYHKKDNYFLEQLNYFLETLKPFSFNGIIFKKLSLDIPLIIYVTTIIIKKIFSKKITFIYLLLYIFLPCCCHFILNKEFIEIYFNLHIINRKKISIKNFWKIFLIGFTPFIFEHLLTYIFRNFSDIKIIIDIISIIYGSYISEKNICEFIILISIINNKNDLRNIIKERDGFKIIFIFIVFYFLLSYIINL